MKTALASLSMLFALVAAPLAAQDFAIVNATVGTGDGSEPIANATVVVRDGKVVAVEQGIVPDADLPRIDGTGKWVTPGIVAAVTDLGLWDVGAVRQSNDRAAAQARFNAALDVAPAINPASQHIAINRAHGLTRAAVAPAHGNALFAGHGALIDLGADPNAVQRSRAFQLVALGEGGAALAGGSRTAAHVELRNALHEAREYARGRWSGEDALLSRADAEALGAVIDGREALFVEVNRAADIRSVLALRADYPRLKLVLVGASEGWLVADEIAAAKVPVIANALNDLPTSFEQIAATQSNIGRMKRAGVTVAINAEAMENPFNLAQYAGNLVALGKIPGAAGLSWGEALQTITSAPARIAGFGGELGVLRQGALADVVIWDGDPLELGSMPEKLFIGGVEQPRLNHQSELAKRYRDLDESARPKAYDW